MVPELFKFISLRRSRTCSELWGAFIDAPFCTEFCVGDLVHTGPRVPERGSIDVGDEPCLEGLRRSLDIELDEESLDGEEEPLQFVTGLQGLKEAVHECIQREVEEAKAVEYCVVMPVQSGSVSTHVTIAE